MPSSPNLALPYIVANQAQKHVPHNDALALIDGLLQLSVVARNVNTPPASPSEGQRWLIGPTPVAEWAGQAGTIGLRSAGTWQFLTPREGWATWVEAENIYLIFDGATWAVPPAPQVLQNMTMVGVNATADSTNRLSVNSAAVLLNNTGNGVQVKLNKNAATDTASLLYQTGFSGRAELGTAGDDGFHLKVSADGASWKEALVADATSGLVKAFANPLDPLGLATKQYVDANLPLPGGTTGQVQIKGSAGFAGITLSGDVILNATTGVVSLAAGAVSNAKQAPMPPFTFKANNTAAAAGPFDLSLDQMQQALNLNGQVAAKYLVMN